MKTSSANSKANIAELLERWRNGDRLSEEDTSIMWYLIQKFVNRNADRHYKNKQGKGYRFRKGGSLHVLSQPISYRVINFNRYERHWLRVLWLFQFVKENSHKSTKWCLDAWKRRTAWIELLVEANLSGVKLYPDNLTLTQQINKVDTRKIVYIKDFVRKHNLDPFDKTRIVEKYKDEHPNQSDASIKKMVSLYYLFLFAKHPKLRQIHKTRCQPKRTHSDWD